MTKWPRLLAISQVLPLTLDYAVQADNWDINMAPGVPQQDNGYDCGVFTMLAMKRVCMNQDYGSLSYDQSSVTALERALCTLECAYGILHNHFSS